MAIPVDVYIPGCPARPEAIIDGVVKALGVVKTKLEAAQKGEAPAAPAPVEVWEVGAGAEEERKAPAADVKEGEGQ
jgi:ech hydrogenase subunit C